MPAELVDLEERRLDVTLDRMDDAYLVFCLLVLAGTGEDGVVHAARSENTAKVARHALSQALQRWAPPAAVEEAFRRLAAESVAQ